MPRNKYAVAYWLGGKIYSENSPFTLQIRKALNYAGMAGYRGVLETAFTAAGLRYDGVSSNITDGGLDSRQFHRLIDQGVTVVHVASYQMQSEQARDRLRRTVEAGRLAVAEGLESMAWDLGKIKIGDHQKLVAALVHTGQLFVPDRDNGLPQQIADLAGLPAQVKV